MNRSLNLVFLFAALCAILFSTACDLTVDPSVLAYSDANCQPKTNYVTQMGASSILNSNLPKPCATVQTLTRQFRLASPTDKEITLHVYTNYTPGWYLRVFGVKSGNAPVSLLDCERRRTNYTSIPVDFSGQPTFDYLLIDYQYDEVANGAEITGDHFFGIAAYDDAPEYDKLERKRGFALACDGKATDRLVLSSCNRDDNLKDLAEEMGLTVIRETGSGNRRTLLAQVSPGMETNTTPPGKKTKPIRRDSTESVVERDYLIYTEQTVVNPNPNDMSDKEILLAFNCLAYDPKNGTDGEVMVTVLDSGVEPGDLMFKEWSEFAYNGRSSTQYLQAGSLGYDFVDNDPVPNDQLGHGTAVSGAIIGQYRGEARLDLVNHKIFGDEGFATYFGAIEATYAAIDHGTDFINMSWGITQEEPTYALGCALEEANNKGVIVVTTAGNDAMDIDKTPQWPGAYAADPAFKNVYTVGSFFYNPLVADTNKAERAEFSNFGKGTVSLYAYLTTEVPTFGSNNIGLQFGTSISAPMVVREMAARLGNGEIAFPDLANRNNGFFPIGVLNASGGAIEDHEVRILPVICEKEP